MPDLVAAYLRWKHHGTLNVEAVTFAFQVSTVGILGMLSYIYNNPCLIYYSIHICDISLTSR